MSVIYSCQLPMHCCKMASYGSNLEVWENYSVENIIKVQACVRRWLVKNMVKEIKGMYTNVVIDLEGQETEIIWQREILSCPSFRKVKTAATDLTRMKESSLVSHSCNHEVSQLPVIKQTASIPDSHISLDIEKRTVKPQNTISSEAHTDSPYDDLDLMPSSKPDLPFAVKMVDSALRRQNFVSVEAQTESHIKDSVERPESNPVYPFVTVTNQTSQRLVAATENAFNNISALSLDYGENISPQPQSSGRSNDQRQYQIEPVSHFRAQISVERLQPDKDDGETHGKIVGTNNQVAQGSEVISGLSEPSQQELSIKEEVTTISRDLPDDKEQLLQLKSTMAMELLWVQQAINSRKNYLRLKQGLQ